MTYKYRPALTSITDEVRPSRTAGHPESEHKKRRSASQQG
jgi:hypothetical protein